MARVHPAVPSLTVSSIGLRLAQPRLDFSHSLCTIVASAAAAARGVQMRCVSWPIWGLVFLFLSTQASLAEEILEVSRSFIDKYKNKLTIDATYIVDAAHKKPNPPNKDGDMHVAGRAAEIGLATVAEIQNAKDVPDAVASIKNVEGSGQTMD